MCFGIGCGIKKNESNTDRMIRALVSGTLLVLGFFALEGVLQTTAYVLSAIIAITAITGFCGLYTLFGFSTCPVKPAVAKRVIGKKKKNQRK